jgi:hypothetical protein
MKSQFLNLFIWIIISILLSASPISVFAQKLDIKGNTKHKTAVYFGSQKKDTESLLKGTLVSITDADNNYFTIKYNEGVGYVLREDINYNSKEVDAYVTQKEKVKQDAIQAALVQTENQKAKVENVPVEIIYGVTNTKTKIYESGRLKVITEVPKNDKLVIIGRNYTFFFISHNGVKARVYKQDIEDYKNIDDLAARKAEENPTEYKAETDLSGDTGIDPLILAGDLLIRSSNSRLAGIGISFASSMAMSLVKESDLKMIIGVGGIIAGIGLYISGEVLQKQAGQLIKQKGLSFSTTKNGIGMVYKF